MSKTVALDLVGVTKCFGKVVANNNVDLTVYKGEILSILGENGCGKTTLMNMIAGIYFPDKGQIFVDGEEVVIRSPKDAFKYGIGMIHQHFKLVDVFSASENVALGINDGKKYSIKDVNNRVLEIAERYGFNIDPKKKIYEMSVSEKQTVEIIKVLYRGADILILDEPTAALDPIAENDIYLKYNEMTSGCTSVYISHRLASTRFCSRIILLADGAIAEEGTHASLMEQGGRYAELFNVQSRYYREGRDFDEE